MIVKRPTYDKTYVPIKYHGAKIFIHTSPPSAGVRIILGIIFSPMLLLGLKGCFEIAKLILGYGNGSENIILGLLVTLLLLFIPCVGLWFAMDSGRTLILDPETQQAHLRKQSIFRTVEKRFSLRQLSPCLVHEDAETSWIWHGKMRLPDKTRIEFRIAGHIDGKKAAETWRNRINAMIAH